MKCTKCQSKGHFEALHQDRETTASAAEQPREFPRTLLHTARAFINHNGLKIPVKVFLDTGSSISFVSQRVIDELRGIQPRQDAMIGIQGFGAEPVSLRTSQFRLQVESMHDPHVSFELLAFKHPDLRVNPHHQLPDGARRDIKSFQATHPLADDSLLGSMPSEPPQILVGLDQMYKIVYPTPEVSVSGNLAARSTKLGWVIGGPVASVGCGEILSYCLTCCHTQLTSTSEDIEKLWNLESIGIEKESGPDKLTAHESSAVQQFESSLTYNGEFYTVSLPKKESFGCVKSNLSLALNRLDSKVRSLSRNPATYARYDQEIRAFEKEGFARAVPDFNRDAPEQHCGAYYMPHHQRVSGPPERPKWRIVFDCSSGDPRKASLNAHLLPGPDVNPSLVECLLKVRTKPVAVSGDIAKAYMQIRLIDEDCKLFRFLWKGPDDHGVKCYEMGRVTWGAVPSGFLLAATLRKHFKLIDPSNEFQLADCFYHDDLLRGFDNPRDAREFIQVIRSGLQTAGMKLSKWKTNSGEVHNYLQKIGYEVSAQSKQTLLGIVWCTVRDTFSLTNPFANPVSPATRNLTKRGALHLVASIFDPMGWCLPFTLRGKLILREISLLDSGWDQNVPEEIARELRSWCLEAKALEPIEIPRAYNPPGEVAERHLHVFGDASEKSYAAAAFVQTHFSDGSTSTALMMAKSRIAPKNPQTLPRLELLASLLASRLRNFLCKAMPDFFDRTFLYTDSTVTYYWVTASDPGRWKQFVANRVAEIQLHTDPSEWFLLPGETNIADFATRGVSAAALAGNNLWWNGPDWLSLALHERPAQQPQRSHPDHEDAIPELRGTVTPVVISGPPIIDMERFSSFEKLVRVTAEVIRCTNLLRKLPPVDRVALLNRAEMLLIKWTQQQYLAKEISCVSKGIPIPASSKLAKYRLTLSGGDGILRLETRLANSPFMTPEEKEPIVLPGESRLASLLILQQHRVNAHFGVQTILCNLRRRFWITRARQVAKAILSRCVVCRRRRAQPADQKRAPLPDFRANLLIPFAATGVDFCGPFYTRDQETTSKSYIALFTCSATRAIHLELVRSQNTADFHLALRRFLSAHPGCTQLISDNGRTFVRAASDLKRMFRLIKDKDVMAFLESRRISWNFNCPRAAWHGGFFERLVKSVKDPLAKTLGRSLVSFDVLRTIIQEIAAVVNSRPLTHQSDDPDELKPITPADFLGSSGVIPLSMQVPSERETHPLSAPELLRAARASANYSRHLASRWQREYLQQLRSANIEDSGKDKPLKIGDVALLRDAPKPRLQWQLVRVTEAHLGRDGRPRTYSIRFSNGTITRRPAQSLCPLEVAT